MSKVWAWICHGFFFVLAVFAMYGFLKIAYLNSLS